MFFRKFFKKIHPPEERGTFLDLLLEKYSFRYTQCNPNCEFTTGKYSLLVFSSVLISIILQLNFFLV